MYNLKNLLSVVAVIAAINLGYGQTFFLDPVSGQNIGTYYLKNQGTPTGANFFHLTGDGFFSSHNNSTRHYPPQLGTPNFLAESYRLDPYTVQPPFRLTTGTTHGTGYYPANLLHTPSYLNGATDVGTSWLPNQITYNYFILKAIRPPANGKDKTTCVEYHYDHTKVKVDISNPSVIKIRDDYPNANANLRWFLPIGETTSTMTGYTRKISWDFNSLATADTGLVYIPMQALGLVASSFKIGTKYCNETVLREKTFNVAATPNDPNTIEAHEECFYQSPNIPSDVSNLPAHKINYTVRFQNQGTGPATNVQVVIPLDTKIDHTSIEILESEYPCNFTVTPLPNFPSNYRLVITFTGINLPGIAQVRPTVTYDESESWVKLKMCTKNFATLQIVDACLPTPNCCFNHQASIYFDIQPAVYTNTASTCIMCTPSQKRVNAELCPRIGFRSNNLKGHADIIPNPAYDYIKLSLTEPIENAQVQIFDQTGRAVINQRYAYIDQNTIIDIKDLHFGNYTVKLTSNATQIAARFIKQ